MTTRTLEITAPDGEAARVVAHYMDLIRWELEHLPAWLERRGGSVLLDGKVLPPR